jgi:UDP-GlcNAc:undecaprenyl-phosphate GlcNAc-1-phosphate transferase
MGITHRHAVMLLYGVSILLMVSAIAIALGRSWESGVALLVASVVLIALIRFVGYFEYVRSSRAALLRHYDARTRALRRLVPAFTAELADAATEDQLWSRLVSFATRAECSFLSLEIGSGGARRWSSEPPATEASRRCSVRFPVGPLGRLEFGFPSDEKMSAHSDILLQLCADAVATALARARAPEAASSRIGLPVAASPAARASDARRMLATR